MKPHRYAEGTSVSVEKTRADLEKLLARHGASQRAVFVDDATGKARVQFRLADRLIALDVQAVAAGSQRWSKQQRLDQGAREAWRRLLLLVKAKLEAIADGTSTAEREFLADLLLPDGSKVGDALKPQIAESYSNGRMPPLLGSGS